jgi:DNA excision repair protein ERCC-4
MFQPSNPEELRVILKSFTSAEGDEALLLLQDLQPRYVLFYDTEISFIRAVEIYAALSTTTSTADSALQLQDPVQVYFLIFEASAEEKNFMKSLEREQNSFERLIQHKKTMPPPALQMHASQEMQLAANNKNGATYMGGSLPLAFDSRTGKGKSNTSKERRDIAVDVREFRSALPSILHQGGMRLAPVTLTVGDFVLSSVHCVERKSISDVSHGIRHCACSPSIMLVNSFLPFLTFFAIL